MSEQLLAEIEARAKATPGPCEYGIRRDGSMWMSIGDPAKGPHIQADWEFGEHNAEAFTAARTDIPRLVAALRVAVDWITENEVLDRIESALKGDAA